MDAARSSARNEEEAIQLMAREIPAAWRPDCLALARTCCGQTLFAEAIEVEDHDGHFYFAPVWNCPTCDRVIIP